MNFDHSKCKKGLHKFVTLQSHQQAVYERCIKCGKKHIISLVKGEPNIIEYARYHQREFLVPQHRLFALEFQKV